MRTFIGYSLITLIAVLATANPSQAQVSSIDSLREFSNGRIIIDSVEKKTLEKKHRKNFDPNRPLPDPKKAALFSAVLPGLGQAYNRRYWKIPIVYAALIGMGIAVNYNNNLYVERRTALFSMIDDDPETQVSSKFTGISESVIRNATDDARNDRDRLIIYSGIVYALNIIEAHIDAHLQEFNINEDLALKIEPKMTDSFQGISLALKIK